MHYMSKENIVSLQTSEVIGEFSKEEAEKNKKILDNYGITSLFSELKQSASDWDQKKGKSIIAYVTEPKDVKESATLIYMRGDFDKSGKKDSLTVVASVYDQNRIHLKFREVKKNNDEENEKLSVFDMSDPIKNKEMLEIIRTRFSTYLNPSKA